MWQITQFSEIGAREVQEDRAFCWQNAETIFCGVIDGMGGQQGGAFASEFIYAKAHAFWKTQDISSPGKLQDFCQKISDELNQYHNEPYTPQATACLALIDQKTVRWIHVGDCRVYHIKADACSQLTQDHTAAQMWVNMGRMRELDGVEHPTQSVVLQAMGSGRTLDISEQSFPLNQLGDLLLCTDGFWQHLKTAELQQLAQCKETQTLIKKYMLLIKARAGSNADNMSCIHVRATHRYTSQLKSNFSKILNVLGIVKDRSEAHV